jgi:hypothetical protein
MARTRKSRRKTSRRPARKARPAARKIARKGRKTPRGPRIKVRAKSARRPKPAARQSNRRAATRGPAKRLARRGKPQTKAKSQAKPNGRVARSATQEPARKPILNRIRRLLADEERMGVAAAASQAENLGAQAVSGRGALRAELSRHTEGGPALTAGDLDAKWQDAYAVGDEAPGGDNPTPDQDRVDDIGKALGIQYQDDQELQGGEEVIERDRHRWELDPASSDDWPHDKK